MDALCQYIPLQPGQSAFVKEQGMISELLGIPGYEIFPDGYIVFTEDLTASGITAVDMQLAVLDFDHYSDYDLLPLSADMAGDVIKEVAALLMQTPMTDKRVDSTVTEPQGK